MPYAEGGGGAVVYEECWPYAGALSYDEGLDGRSVEFI
jgi:hypothetical protein